MFCIKCGNQLAEGVSFCTNCGTPAGSAPQDAAAAQPQQTPQAGTTINVDYDSSSQQVIPYQAPVMQDGNIIIPMHRKYRILCPDCRHVSNDIKRMKRLVMPARSAVRLMRMPHRFCSTEWEAFIRSMSHIRSI